LPFFLLLGALSLSIFAATTDELIAQATSQHLENSRYWHLLMHAPKGESEIDDDAFFMAPDGKYNLGGELNATIRHLNDDVNRSDESLFCRFPARRAWLEKELRISFGEGECRQYEALLTKMDPKKVTLVFPSAHINSPASMFGHTFLRIDSSMESKLMSYAINYAAQTAETNGLLFAYKGLFGGYFGFYSMLPYYEKLKEYRDSESRDVWEYDLNLTPDEVRAMVRHIWELQRINSRYYFFDENCSYHMLWLSEIARPSLHLREYFRYYVIPPDTVRAFEEEGVVGEKHFRASKRSKLLAYEGELNPTAIGAVQLLASGKMEAAAIKELPLSVQDQRYGLEAAAELTEFVFIEGKMSKEAYGKRYHTLLSERAALGQGEVLPTIAKPNPDTAHRSARLEMAQGWLENRSPLMIGFRPAFHDLGEVDAGHLTGAQIEFLDTLLGIENNTLTVEKLTLLSLASIAPVSYFFKPLSWRMKIGWDREYGSDRLSFVTRLGVGTSIGNDRVFGYLLSEPEVRAGFNPDAGIGLTAGGGINWGKAMKSYLETGHIVYLDQRDRSRLSFSHRWQWSSHGALFFQYDLYRQAGREDRLHAGISLYF
jgi:hypothetical protein